MATSRMNVLVYSGNGASLESVRQALYSLRRSLSPNYAVLTVSGDTILKEPWMSTCALLVMPGGGDLGYCRTLNGDGNRRIRSYVENGGAYMGLCAGGYYGTSKCEFERGVPGMEVIGDRELAFFPGISRGSAFKGFVYGSEAGARAAEVKVIKTAFGSEGVLPETFRCYLNGGSVFVNADKFKDQGIETLVEYTEQLDVDPEYSAAAAVYCKVGTGAAILTGPHPEFAAVNLSKHAKGMDPKVVDDLLADDKHRSTFFRACLQKLGLRIGDQEQAIPSLTPIHLCSPDSEDATAVSSSLASLLTEVKGKKYLKANNDHFEVSEASAVWSMQHMTKAILELLATGGESPQENPHETETDRIIDYGEVVKSLIIHSKGLPTAKETPYFNLAAYYANLRDFNKGLSKHIENDTIGRCLLYGEVVTSTSTLLEKNSMLTDRLPHGTTMTATTQISGRGRGSNVWVAPSGALMFSSVLRHPLSINVRAPVVFIQYLAAIAVAEGIQNYDQPSSSFFSAASSLGPAFSSTSKDSAYKSIPVKLKWPNDIYALDPSKPHADPADRNAYVKIGGILVNSAYAGGDYTLVLGVGLNVANAAPTTSLNAIVAHLNKQPGRGTRLQPFTLEKLLARILSAFNAIYSRFKVQGFAGEIEQLYYKHWLHDQQIVTLEEEGGARAKIQGITTDWGMLKAEEVDGGRTTGRVFALQNDSNSFDFFRGLIKRKI